MRKIVVAACAAAALVTAVAPSGAQAYTGPCEKQRAMFDKYNIELNMDAPLVAEAYWTACSVTG